MTESVRKTIDSMQADSCNKSTKESQYANRAEGSTDFMTECQFNGQTMANENQGTQHRHLSGTQVQIAEHLTP